MLVVVCLREPLRVALPIYTALIPFGGLLSVGHLAVRVGVLAAWVCCSAPACWPSSSSGRRFAPRLSASVPVWTVFLGLAVASTFWTVNRSVTLEGLGVLASLVVVFLLVAVSDVDRAVVRRTETSLLIGSVAAVGYGIFQLVFEGGLVD